MRASHPRPGASGEATRGREREAQKVVGHHPARVAVVWSRKCTAHALTALQSNAGGRSHGITGRRVDASHRLRSATTAGLRVHPQHRSCSSHPLPTGVPRGSALTPRRWPRWDRARRPGGHPTRPSGDRFLPLVRPRRWDCGAACRPKPAAARAHPVFIHDARSEEAAGHRARRHSARSWADHHTQAVSSCDCESGCPRCASIPQIAATATNCQAGRDHAALTFGTYPRRVGTTRVPGL